MQGNTQSPIGAPLGNQVIVVITAD